jgi:DNA-binding MarR family transcriptional regulator
VTVTDTPTPEAPAGPFVENTRRSIDVIERDRMIAKSIAVSEEGKFTVDALAERLGLKRNATYASIVNLKRREFVAKERTDSRTPIWFLTELGRQYVEQLPPAS